MMEKANSYKNLGRGQKVVVDAQESWKMEKSLNREGWIFLKYMAMNFHPQSLAKDQKQKGTLGLRQEPQWFFTPKVPTYQLFILITDISKQVLFGGLGEGLI